MRVPMHMGHVCRCVHICILMCVGMHTGVTVASMLMVHAALRACVQSSPESLLNTTVSSLLPACQRSVGHRPCAVRLVSACHCHCTAISTRTAAIVGCVCRTDDLRSANPYARAGPAHPPMRLAVRPSHWWWFTGDSERPLGIGHLRQRAALTCQSQAPHFPAPNMA